MWQGHEPRLSLRVLQIHITPWPSFSEPFTSLTLKLTAANHVRPEEVDECYVLQVGCYQQIFFGKCKSSLAELVITIEMRALK